jgi:hypothetical protein
MCRDTSVALVSLGLLLGTAGCDAFLTGNSLTENPNFPTTASIQPLFVGVQAGQFTFQEATAAMMMCEWVQQCGAANGRFVQQAGQYVFGETSNIAANFGDWLQVYGGGGLVDIRRVKALARAAGDSTWLGIAKVWEGLTIGTASDLWGDIPYSRVDTTSSNPPLDTRFTILAALQTLLDEAIAELSVGMGAGPGNTDLIFNAAGDQSVATQRAKWLKVAYTLKARYYMHTAESLGTPAYTNAIVAALNGIADASGAGDLRSFHTKVTAERNMWSQFQVSSGFGTDLEAGRSLTDYMNARNDPRRAAYFCLNALGGYGGDDFNVAVNPDSISGFSCLPPRFAPDARIPYVSYAENELILAEAYNQTGDDASARTHLNNELATVPLPPVAATVVGAALLDSIMMEKYVAMFQNIETINDYRRTCIPAITPVGNAQGFTHVPGRLFYPQAERNANTNIPDPSLQLATHGFRNQGDVHACQGSDLLP